MDFASGFVVGFVGMTIIIGLSILVKEDIEHMIEEDNVNIFSVMFTAAKLLAIIVVIYVALNLINVI